MWNFPDQTTWESNADGNEFVVTKINGQAFEKAAHLPIAKLVSARLHPGSPSQASCTADRPGALFPSEFRYCPECGVELKESSAHVDGAWYPPFGNAEGSKVIDWVAGPFEEIAAWPAVSAALPFNTGRLRFICAKMGVANRILVAVDLRDGVLAIYNPLSEAWCELISPLQPSGLPDWAWTAALSSSESHVVVPDCEGIHVMRAHWSRHRWLSASSFRGRCLAGPGVLSDGAPGKPSLSSDLICAPIKAEGGGLTLACWNEGSESWMAVPMPTSVPQDELLGLPARPRRRMLVWPGRTGLLLVVMLPGAVAPKIQWQPWPTTPGHQIFGLPELGPCWRDQSDALWQVCEEKGGGRYGDDINIKRIRVDDVSDAQVLPYGDILTTGRVAFSRYHDHWRSPDEYVDTEPDRRTIRLPLLQFIDPAAPGLQQSRTLVAHMQLPNGTEDIDLSHLITHGRGLRGRMHLELAGSGVPPVRLRIPGDEPESWSMAMEAFSATQACIHDNHLWVFLPQPDRLLRWSLPRPFN